MSWRLVVIEKGEYLRLKLDNLLVKSGRDEVLIPLSDISMIVIENLDAILTTRLLDACTINNVVVVTCDYKHQPVGIYNGLNTHSRASKVLVKQLKWSDNFKERTWQHIIKAKIFNQIEVLKYLNLDQKNIELLYTYLDDVQIGDATNREGHTAKVYFNTLFGKSFKRDDDTLINGALNYTYSVVRAYFTRMLVGYGYTGLIGLFHKSEYNNFNLVDDLMEPFRPIVDQYVVSLIDEHMYFTLDLRLELLDFLNHNVIYLQKQTTISNCIEKYIQLFMKYCDSNVLIDFTMPNIKYE
ncbi:MAG: type II CRISPR-associated endonuclease Cas1, partial [Bacilli bacterium]